METTRAHELARLSLDGLSVGDAFGQLFFRIPPGHPDPAGLLPPVWPWTDDTHMALSVVEILTRHGHVDQDELSRAFARRFAEDPYRGYAEGAVKLLSRVLEGEDWRVISPALFGGGSYGNGAAMRVAPVGAFFHDDLERAAQEARNSAVVTHAHPEAQAGAAAVAVAAAIAAGRPFPTGQDFLEAVLSHVPESITGSRIREAIQIPPDALSEAVDRLGTGDRLSSQDTVPFCLWSAAHHLDDYEASLWWTVRGLGDCDTTCAIVGGIVALSAPGVPRAWLDRREPLGF